MLRLELCVLLTVFSVILVSNGQEYDFAAEITRQCLVPDPVGLLDCVEKKVTLPYVTSWVDCTNSLGQNVRTSEDIINYRCKSVWEGKPVIPEVFYIKDCVIEKTGLPPKNVSAEVLGAYKECESGGTNSQQTQSVKTAPPQQQQLQSSFEYNTPQSQVQSVPVNRPQPIQPAQRSQQFQIPAPIPAQPQVPVMIRGPVQQVFQAPAPQMPASQFQGQMPRLSSTSMNPPFSQALQRPMQINQQQVPVGLNVQSLSQTAPQYQPNQRVTATVGQQYGSRLPRPQYQPQTQVRPVQRAPIVFNQQNFQPAPRPQYQPQIQARLGPTPQYQPQTQMRVPPVAFSQQYRPQYQGQAQQAPPSQPYSQQYFAIYPQAPLPNQQQRVSQPILSQKTAARPSYITQQQIDVAGSNAYNAVVPSGPFMYSFQINHPRKPQL